jgi:glycosyltransferase involved in cell wall biosynthesis
MQSPAGGQTGLEARNGRLLMVIPAVLRVEDGRVLLDEHYANNLRSYLNSFEHVVVASPAFEKPQKNLIPLEQVEGHERTTVHVLPLPYREDRYLRHRGNVRRLLDHEIAAADFVMLSPHSAFDWSTLAGVTALESGRRYGMEADWDLQSVWAEIIRDMPAGARKLRQSLWLKLHTPSFMKVLEGSSLALLQGAAVFDAYRNRAPNPHRVLNVQISDEDRIDVEVLARKAEEILKGAPLRIAYAGRMISMKGPFDWLSCLERLRKQKVPFVATWLGDGDLRTEFEERMRSSRLENVLSLPGNVARDKVRETVERSHLFVFCHKTQESPRCLLEALALGTPLVGYDSLHARNLTTAEGGGVFVDMNDVDGLASAVAALNVDRPRLATLMRSAFASAQTFDREAAIQERITLIKQYLGR